MAILILIAMGMATSAGNANGHVHFKQHASGHLNVCRNGHRLTPIFSNDYFHVIKGMYCHLYCKLYGYGHLLRWRITIFYSRQWGGQPHIKIYMATYILEEVGRPSSS